MCKIPAHVGHAWNETTDEQAKIGARETSHDIGARGIDIELMTLEIYINQTKNKNMAQFHTHQKHGTAPKTHRTKNNALKPKIWHPTPLTLNHS